MKKAYRIGIMAFHPVLVDIANALAVELEPQGIELEVAYIDPSDELGLLEAARRLEETCEVIVTRVDTAPVLTPHIGIPVVERSVSSRDILDALYHARSKGARVGLVLHPAQDCELGFWPEVLGIQVRKEFYRDIRAIGEAVQRAVANGAEVVVGSALANTWADAMGVPHQVIAIGRETLLGCVRKAQDIASAVRRERERASLVRGLIEYAHEAMVLLDSANRVVDANKAFREMFRLGDRNLSGTSAQAIIDEFAPEYRDALGPVLVEADRDDPGPRLGEVLRMGDRTLVANVAPIRVDGDRLGTVITFAEATELQQIEWKVRQQLADKGMVARYGLEDLVGSSEAIRLLKQRVAAFAATDSTVLLYGETGTGKEIVAHSIHRLSPRSSGPFVSVNCSALPRDLVESELFGYEEGAFTGARRRGKPGLFELAHKGTIFLDEIGTLPPDLQAKLLRVIEEKRVMRLGGTRLIPVDVRIIAATNTSLEEAVSRNEFRQDLFFRLNILHVRIPPLRERPEDVPLLLEHFVQKLGRELNRRVSVPPAHHLTEQLKSYHWPGNVRELRNFAERFVALACHEADAESCFRRLVGELLASGQRQKAQTQASPEPLPRAEFTPPEAPKASPGTAGEAASVEAIAQMVVQSQRDLLYSVGMSLNWNRKKMAKALGISTTTLWRRLRKTGIREFRLEPLPAEGDHTGGEPLADRNVRH